MPDILGDWNYLWPFGLGGGLAYLLGSIPFGLLLTRYIGKQDLRKIGSGNIGATNVLRSGSKKLAALTLLLDFGKGLIAARIGALFGPDMMVICAVATVLGHIFPIWLKLRGGKGVATALGVAFALSWPIGILACLSWILAVWITRMSSAGALFSFFAVPLYSCGLSEWPAYGQFFSRPQLTEVFFVITLLIFYRHMGNIHRIVTGQEPKIGQKIAPRTKE